MSHFTVLLTHASTEEDISNQLLPFCENTDALSEQYLSFEDNTEEYRQEFEKEGKSHFISPDGQTFNSWDNIEKNGSSYQKSPFPNEQSKRPHEWMSSEAGWTETFTAFKDEYITFEKFCEDYHGSTPDEKGRYGFWHNPHAKWDWYSLGGRWRGFFRLFPGCSVGELGEAGVFGNPAPSNHVDWVEKQYIDFTSMMEDAKISATQRYEIYQELIVEHGLAKSWGEMEEEAVQTSQDVRTLFWEQPLIKVMQEKQLIGLFASPEDVLNYGDGSVNASQEYIETHRLGAVIPFALLHQNQWHQRGEMGWFGSHQSEMTYAQWVRHAWSIIDALPPTSKLALMDCHI